MVSAQRLPDTKRKAAKLYLGIKSRMCADSSERVSPHHAVVRHAWALKRF
jgi:hypothetical protein